MWVSRIYGEQKIRTPTRRPQEKKRKGKRGDYFLRFPCIMAPFTARSVEHGQVAFFSGVVVVPILSACTIAGDFTA